MKYTLTKIISSAQDGPKRPQLITISQYKDCNMKLNKAQTSKRVRPPTMRIRYYEDVCSLQPTVRAQFDLVQ
jgi:hypothetical protein